MGFIQNAKDAIAQHGNKYLTIDTAKTIVNLLPSVTVPDDDKEVLLDLLSGDGGQLLDYGTVIDLFEKIAELIPDSSDDVEAALAIYQASNDNRLILSVACAMMTALASLD